MDMFGSKIKEEKGWGGGGGGGAGGERFETGPLSLIWKHEDGRGRECYINFQSVFLRLPLQIKNISKCYILEEELFLQTKEKIEAD